MKKPSELDRKLGDAIKKIPLESIPGDFTLSVMEKIGKETVILKKKRIPSFYYPIAAFFLLGILSITTLNISVFVADITRFFEYISKTAVSFSTLISSLISRTGRMDVITLAGACSILFSLYLITYIHELVKE